jgi:hypothetical protein
METRVDRRLQEEAKVFAFRFECEQCAYFVEPSGRCAEGFPNGMHRAGRLASVDRLVFCKRFELV